MQIIDALNILANTWENQSAYLTDLGTSPSTDELALQFTDTYQIYKSKLYNGKSLYNEDVLHNLDRINSFFDQMSNIPNNSFWNVSSLESAEWNEIRMLASETLKFISNSRG